MKLVKTFQFDSAHCLTAVPKTHKCSNLHGHTFTVDVQVEGPMDEEMGWVIDFHDMKAAVKEVIDQLDHTYLNEIEGLENPTSENIARWIWKRLKPTLPLLSSITIRETCNSACIYEGEE